MTEERFDALVACLEEPARRDPRKGQLTVFRQRRLRSKLRACRGRVDCINRGQTPTEKTGV